MTGFEWQAVFAKAGLTRYSRDAAGKIRVQHGCSGNIRCCLHIHSAITVRHGLGPCQLHVFMKKIHFPAVFGFSFIRLGRVHLLLFFVRSLNERQNTGQCISVNVDFLRHTLVQREVLKVFYCGFTGTLIQWTASNCI